MALGVVHYALKELAVELREVAKRSTLCTLVRSLSQCSFPSSLEDRRETNEPSSRLRIS